LPQGQCTLTKTHAWDGAKRRGSVRGSCPSKQRSEVSLWGAPIRWDMSRRLACTPTEQPPGSTYEDGVRTPASGSTATAANCDGDSFRPESTRETRSVAGYGLCTLAMWRILSLPPAGVFARIMGRRAICDRCRNMAAEALRPEKPARSGHPLSQPHSSLGGDAIAP